MFLNSLKKRFLQLSLTTVVGVILWMNAIGRLFTTYGLDNYEYLPAEVIETQLYREISPKLALQKSKPDCTYRDILRNDHTIDPWEAINTNETFKVNGIENGSYVPEHCNPMFSVALLVTYRNRQEQLQIFLPYMHNFLRKQNIHYKIYLIEQQDDHPWNKGVLYNIGAKQAISDKFPCFILHDVDLLPLDSNNLYVCLNEPRHVSASIDKFRYQLIYYKLVGGVLAIKADQYAAVNGFSNRFVKWGGEDDDFWNRLMENKLNVLRFPPNMSRYTMLKHRQEVRNVYRHQLLHENNQHSHLDGLNTLPYHNIKIKNHKLFTLISVQL